MDFYSSQQTNTFKKVKPAERLAARKRRPIQKATQQMDDETIHTIRPQSPLRGQLLQRLEHIEDELKHDPNQTGSMRWMIPYADLLTLLLGLFLALMAFAMQDKQFFEQLSETLQNNVTQQEALLAEKEADLQKLKGSLNKLVDSISAEQAEKNTLLARLEEVDPTQPGTNTDALAQQLADLPSMQIHQEPRGLVITLLDKVLFQSGQAELSPAAKKTLDELATIIKATPNNIQVEGHTDNTPIKTAMYPSNWYLSTARATKIIEYWVTQHHFDPTRLSAAGYGPYRPVDGNLTERGKQRNRRVDIILLNESGTTLNQDNLPQLSSRPASTITETARASQPETLNTAKGKGED